MTIAKSSFPKITLPDQDVWSLLFERQTNIPSSKPMFLDASSLRSYTFDDVKGISIDFGRAVRAHWDWGPGDVLLTFSPNCVDTPALTWGVLWANGIVSPASPTYSSRELAIQLQDSSAKAILTQAASLPTVIAAAQAVGLPNDRILLTGEADDSSFKHFKTFVDGSFEGAFVHKQTHMERRTQHPDATAFLVYSSGTTGLPKGVMLSHRNIVAQVLMNTEVQDSLRMNNDMTPGTDVILGALPFYHSYGLSLLLHHPIFNGLTVVVLPQFSVERMSAAVHAHGITYAYVVPPMLLALTQAPESTDTKLKSIRMFCSAAAPLSRAIIDKVWQRFGVGTKQAYGLSETSPATHFQRDDEWQRYPGSVGKLLSNQEAKYLGPVEEELPPGEQGELLVRGPNVFRGYLNNVKATEAALTEDGFFRTGDVGYQDDEGNFYITDRVKELIKYKGFQVAPAELEGLLLGHPFVEDACVVGVYDESNASEVPRAYIVLAKSCNIQQSEVSASVMAWLNSRVAPHKRLRGGVRLVSAIPKTASGKILRRVVRDWVKHEEEAVESRLEIRAKL